MWFCYSKIAHMLKAILELVQIDYIRFWQNYLAMGQAFAHILLRIPRKCPAKA